jgi:hypothetical protein
LFIKGVFIGYIKISFTSLPCSFSTYSNLSGSRAIILSSLVKVLNIKGEWVAAINWILGNIFFKSTTIFFCHDGCRCKSSSSIRTTPSFSSYFAFKCGFKVIHLYAMSATIAIIFLKPSLKRLKGIILPSKNFIIFVFYGSTTACFYRKTIFYVIFIIN